MSLREIETLNLEPEAKRKLGEDIAKIENQLDELVTAATRKTRRPKPSVALNIIKQASNMSPELQASFIADQYRVANTPSSQQQWNPEQHRIAIRKLGVSLHELTGGNLNTMRLVCCRVSDRHADSSNARFARLSFIDHAWNEIGQWRA